MTVKSADKKPEKYVGPDGKTKVRMVPVDKQVVSEISLDMLKSKISKSGMDSTKKAMKMDKTKKELEAMKARLATNEKTLTPAELKKREKVAKAIERENPNMPMDKKMAIATATAKKVAEATAPKMKGDSFKQERDRARAHDAAMGRTATGRKKPTRPMTSTQRSLASLRNEKNLDEISSNTLGNYMRKSSADAAKSRGDARRQDKRIGGQKMADDKIRKKMGYSSQAKVAAGKNESTDLTELKKSTLASYIKKASDDRAKNAHEVGKSGKMNYKGLKRRQGINRAVNKLTNEENISEVLDTHDKAMDYKQRAKYSRDRASNSQAAHALRGTDPSKDQDTERKRTRGLKSYDKLVTRKTFRALRGKK